MWQTSSSSTSSWYSYRWLSRPSCCWPHSLQTRAHDRPAAQLLPATLASVVAIGWAPSKLLSLWKRSASSYLLKNCVSWVYICMSEAKIHSNSEIMAQSQKVLSPCLHLDFLLRERNTVRSSAEVGLFLHIAPQEMTNSQSSSNMGASRSCFLSASFLRDKRNSHLT